MTTIKVETWYERYSAKEVGDTNISTEMQAEITELREQNETLRYETDAIAAIKAERDAVCEALKVAQEKEQSDFKKYISLGLELDALQAKLSAIEAQEPVESGKYWACTSCAFAHDNDTGYCPQCKHHTSRQRELYAAPVAPAQPAIKNSIGDGCIWPAGYCTDPNGFIMCPEGKKEDFNFGYNVGYAEALSKTGSVSAGLLTDKAILRLSDTIRYMVGIAERGTGTTCPIDCLPEKFLLDYVKSLEAKAAKPLTKEQIETVLEALEDSYDLVNQDYLTNWRHGIPTREAQLATMKKGVDNYAEAIEIMKGIQG